MNLTHKNLQLLVLAVSLFLTQWTLSASDGILISSEIGNRELGGSATYDEASQTYRLSASGGNVWGSEDNFHFANSAITGDIEVTVKVNGLQATDENAKAGIMFRESLEEDSIHTFLKVSSGQMVALERRHQSGEGTIRSGKGNVTVPVWLRLVKMGTYISAYYSEDGDKWEFLAEDTINFSNTVYVGLAVSSSDQGQSVDATFENLTVLDIDDAPASETYVSSDIGKVGVNGSAAYDAETESYIVEASGGDIGHTQDAFHYVYREIAGNFEGIVKLDTMVAQEDWAKAGLMIRGNDHPDAKYIALFLTQGVGVVYQSRSEVGGGSAWSKTDGIVDPIWIKLVRNGNNFQASYSLNGTDWTLQDSVTIDLPERVLFGMALTSHAEESLAYAEFSNLSDSTVAARNSSNAIIGGIDNGGADNGSNNNNSGGGVVDTQPEADFTSGVSNGGSSLTVNVDATRSIEDGAAITNYSWDWGDGSTGSGAQASHTYQSAGVYLVALTITDATGSTDRITQPVQVTTDSIPSTEIEIVEKGYQHVRLRWTDIEKWDSPWLIQRSTVPAFIDPAVLMDNQHEDNTATDTFRWLGINATQYVDIDGMEEGGTYYYRVAACTNLSDHYQKGAKPQFTRWQYGEVTLGTLAASKKRVYNVTDYGAVPNDGENDFPAAHAAFRAAEAAGGGQIYFPAGNWDLWPTDPDVKLVNGIPTVENGKKYSTNLFFISSDNISFVGEKRNGDPTSFLNFYLWHKQPATKYLEILSGGAGSSVKEVRRYFIFLTNNCKDFTIKDLDFDMGAVPVNTGKAWYTLDEKRFQWDVSHKLLASFDTLKFKNVVVDNIRAKNCRGEVIYNGGGSEKLLIKDSEFSRSNSSTLSGTFDLELVNTVIRDSANSSVESNCLNDAVSFDTGEIYPMNHIARGCTFIGLDQSSKGFMKDLPGKKNFGGWLCFNEEGTYQSVTDSTFKDTLAVAFGPWYEYRNGFRFNTDFYETPGGHGGHLIYTWTSSQGLYTLEGGMSHILWLGDTFHVTKDWPNHQVLFYSQPGRAAQGSESPWTWEGVHFNNVNGGDHKINRIWVDTGGSNSRENAVFKDWTYDPGISFDAHKFQFLSPGHVDPEYINFLQ